MSFCSERFPRVRTLRALRVFAFFSVQNRNYPPPPRPPPRNRKWLRGRMTETNQFRVKLS